MAGGAGFIMQAIQSNRDNRELGKTRPNTQRQEKGRIGVGANQVEISQSILHRFERKHYSAKISWIVWIGLAAVFLTLILLFLLS